LNSSGTRKIAPVNGNAAHEARPFLKWAGGKTQLLSRLSLLFPSENKILRYVEPFVGSGAVFFRAISRLHPRRAILADGNKKLIHLYETVRDDVEGLVRRLARHKRNHDHDYYYRIRAQNEARLSEGGKAARLIYLNKTCFNGLYRLNRRGEFNVPMGRYTDPPILNRANLRAASLVLKGVSLRASDFRKIPSYARKGDFIYFDPPYQPLSRTSSFTSYTGGAFTENDQRDLARVYVRLHKMGCLLMLSNSDSPLIREIYAPFDIRTARARRSINSRSDRRGPVNEVVVLNYQPHAEIEGSVAAAKRRPRRGNQKCRLARTG
jgi:DNA adenine methylase